MIFWLIRYYSGNRPCMFFSGIENKGGMKGREVGTTWLVATSMANRFQCIGERDFGGECYLYGTTGCVISRYLALLTRTTPPILPSSVKCHKIFGLWEIYSRPLNRDSFIPNDLFPSFSYYI